MRKKTIKRVVSAMAIAAVGMSMLAGCAKSKGTAKSGELIKVIIGTQEMPNDEGIAKALDYFSKEIGKEVEIKQFDSGKDVNAALASGSIDFGLLGSCPATIAISQDYDVECIWIHEVLGPTESLVATKASKVSKVEDLKGKTIATPFASTAHFSLLHALGNAGIAESDVKLLDMQPSEIYAAWQNNQIDAAYVWEPTLSELSDKTLLCTSEDLAKSGYMTSNVELVRKEFSKAHPEVVQAYVKALAKAVDLYKDTPKEAVTTISKSMQLSEEDAKSQMEGSSWLTAKEQLQEAYFGTSSKKGNLVQNFYDTAAFLEEQKSITKVPDKSVFEAAVNPSYIEEVLKTK